MGDLDDRVILDVMDDHNLAPGRYPENFVLISLLEVCQEGFLTRDLEDRVILDLMDVLGTVVHPKDHILKVSCHYLDF